MLRCVCALLLFVWILPAMDGSCAQELNTWFPATYEPGTEVNLFTEWNGIPLDEGFVVSLPADWELTRATAVRQAYRSVQLDAVELSRGQILLSSTEPMRGAYDLVLRVRTDRRSLSPHYRISVAAAVKVGARYTANGAEVRRAQLRPLPDSEAGSVLAIEGNTSPLHIQPRWLESLHDSHTLELWVRTTTLNAVLLSTWDGEETTLYPIELVIDPRGRMRYYRNIAGHHVTLATESPVADGNWHHVGLIHDAASHWTRLFLDGQIADSLYDPSGTYMGGLPSLALGGRIRSEENRFAGQMDNLSLWPLVRTATEIQSMMRQTPSAEGVLVLNFESASSFQYFDEQEAVSYRVAGGPVFNPPVRGFSGIVFDQGVMLTWENEDPDSETFLVERSEDGITFNELARIRRSFEGSNWSYTDLEAPDRVVFYRLIQEGPGQTPLIVGTIKLGVGAEAAPSAIEILGNYPNPFNPRTSINYEVREPQHLRLSIINLSGHVVTILVDRHHETGQFEAVWDGNELPSGTYFARLQGPDGIVHTRQILLTK